MICQRSQLLDAMRGLAVLTVLAFHAGLLPGGWLGVQVFFTLSGYLITRQLAAGMAASTFWHRRIARLAPLLFGYLMVNGLLAIAVGHDLTGYGWHFLFLSDQVIARGQAGSHGHVWHLWSIAVEAQAYLIWPLVARRRGVLAAIAIAGTAYWLLAGYPMTLTGNLGFFAIGGLLSPFRMPNVAAPGWLTALGRGGYSIYLWQMLCFAVAAKFGVAWAGAPLALALGLLSARLFEAQIRWTSPVQVYAPAGSVNPYSSSRRNPPAFTALTSKAVPGSALLTRSPNTLPASLVSRLPD